MAKHKKAQRNHKYSLHSRQRKVNRKYKDTIFRMLFKDRKNLLSLYNAMNKKNYTDASALQVVTLENVIYLGMKNDLAFIMDMNLKLRVTVLNVNDGHNKALMEQCQTLKEYAQYVARVRKYVSSNELSLEEAVEKAVTECINENILRDFLSSNRAEVINMSIFEYDKELEEKKLRRAEFQAGMEAGIEQGIAKGQHDLLKQKISAKLAKGKSLELIADELEEDISTVKKLAGII